MNDMANGGESGTAWELALDKPGTADPAHLRWGLRASLFILVINFAAVFWGAIPLVALPQFTTFHATFVFMADAMTGVLLLGQFRYRRLPSYLALACAYLFSSLVTIPFLLSFPGALLAKGSVIGGSQSSIWVWHFWHILFPLIVLCSLWLHERFPERKVAPASVQRVILLALTGVVVLVAFATAAVTLFHDSLPVLIDSSRHPLTANFYLAGATAALLSLAASIFAWRLERNGAILYLWLTVALVAFLCDAVSSLGAHARYTLGWYFGRIEAMIAASILLPVFLGEINLLYRKIAAVMANLSTANENLGAALAEKNELLAELSAREEEIRQLAYHDALTGLPNRRLMNDRLHQALAQARHFNRSVALLFVDLDHFKEVNDAYGHDAGDLLLVETATRLNSCVRSGDSVCRMGGDEFVVILSEISDPGAAALVAEKILKSLAVPVPFHEQPLRIGASIGIAVSTPGQEDGSELVKKADQAMYQAKEAGRNRYSFFSEPAG